MSENQRQKKRLELLDWFKKEASQLANSYEAALRLLEDKSFPDRILLIAHELREVNNSLQEILDPVSEKRESVEYEESLNKISSGWPVLSGLNSEKLENLSEQSVRINMGVALQIDALIQDHRKSQQSSGQFGMLFKILMRKHPSQTNENLQILHDFKNLHRNFVKWSKKRSLITKPVSEEELQQQFNKFEDILYSFVGNFFEGTEELNKLLKHGIQADQIDNLVALIASPHHEAYFFDNFNDHALIPFLKKRGFFNNPLKPEALKGGGIHHPTWPPSRYLARMAHVSPNAVLEVFSKLPDTTNASIIRDLVKSALSMPSKNSSSLVPKICQAAKNKLLFLCFENAVALCIKLAKDGELRSAETLAITLFTPKIEKPVHSSWDEHQYQEGLEKIIPVLAPLLSSEKLLKTLCVWLHLFIESERHYNSESGNDCSFLWRPAIEDHPENQDYNRAGPMVAIVRNGFELSIANNKISLGLAFKIIDKQKHLVFQRIKLHLINKFGEQNPEIAQASILDRALFDQNEYKHEYAKLVEARFPLLNDRQKQEWFSWIESGPSPANLKMIESKASPEQVIQRKRYWKYGKLHWAKEHLTGSLKIDYENLKKEFGVLVLPDLNISSYAEVIGSPIEIKELSQLSFQEAVKTVTQWRPDGRSLSGIEELASAFQEYTSADPSSFSVQSKELIGQPAIFSAKFISAMSNAIKSGSDIDVHAVLNLCQWAISCFSEDSSATPCDKCWVWVRSAIALFIKTICQAKDGDLPKYPMEEFRNSLWKIISCLCQIKEEAVFLEDQGRDPRSEDYIQIGVNSLRGQSIEAALEYARWVFHHLKQRNSSGDRTDLKEVMDMLESRLAAEDRTPGELAMIGSHIHLIYALDKIWLKEHAESFFPLDSLESSSPSIGWAAWNAFLVSSHPHIEFYKLFEKQFSYVAKQAPFIQPPKTGSAHNPIFRLGEHLIILYIRGDLSFDGEKLSLRKFLMEGTPGVRLHSVEFAGKILERHSELSKEVLQRCMGLWNLYWEDNGKVDMQARCWCWPFESWLLCRKFPKDWCLEQFERYLQIAEYPEISNWALEELACIADADLKRSVQILDAAVRGDKEKINILGWQDPIYAILEAALQKDRNCVQSRQLIDYLGRSGYMKFSTLATVL